MLRFYRIVLCLIALCGTMPKRAAIAEGVHQKQVKIGALLSLSGELASFGKAMQEGMELALTEGSSSDFRVLYEDDQSLNRVTTVSATKKLIEIDRVPVIFDMVVNSVTAIAPILNKSKTVGIVMWDSNKQIASLGDYVFGLGYSTEIAGEDLAEFAVKKLNARNIAIISAHDDWSEVYSAAFTAKAESLGGKIVRHDTVNLKETDFKTVLAKVKSVKPDALLGALYGPSLVSWLKQTREQGFLGYLLTGDAISENEIEMAGAASTENLHASQIWVEKKEFAQKYANKFGKSSSPLNLSFVSIGYDSISCLSKLKKVIEHEGQSFTAETVRENLLGFSCEGVTGKFKVGTDRLSDKRESIVVVQNGKFQLAE